MQKFQRLLRHDNLDYLFNGRNRLNEKYQHTFRNTLCIPRAPNHTHTYPYQDVPRVTANNILLLGSIVKAWQEEGQDDQASWWYVV